MYSIDNKQYHMKVLLSSFHLKSYTIGFGPQNSVLRTTLIQDTPQLVHAQPSEWEVTSLIPSSDVKSFVKLICFPSTFE